MAKRKKSVDERQTSMQKKFELAQRRASKAQIPKSLEYLKNERRIMLPYQISTMEADFSKLQQEVILDMFDHIREKLIWQLDPAHKNDSLFKPEDFGEDKDIIIIDMALKEFGVQSNRYPELRGALNALPSITVSIPYIDKKQRKWRKSTPLFDAVLTGEEEGNKNQCVIKIKKDMAEIAIDIRPGYGQIGRNASRSLTTKYAGRLHILMSAHSSLGGFTLNIDEFRRMLGIQNKYLNEWSKVERKVLLEPKEEIDAKFTEGLCDYYYTYELLYNQRPEKGSPDAIKFTIHSTESSLDRKLVVIEKTLAEQFEKDLHEILNIPTNTCSYLSRRITSENGRAAISKIIELQTWLSTHEKTTNKAMFVVKSMNNFFDAFEQKKVENKDLAPIRKWQKIQEVIGQGMSHAIVDVFAQVLFESFNDDEKQLVLTAPSKEFARQYFDDGEYKNILRGKVDEYFGSDVKINLKTNKEE